MRLRDVMSSPVVTVRPGARVKEVAGLLVERGISAVPVVEGGELVGIVFEADLVPLEATPDLRAHLAPVPEPTGHAARTAGEIMTRDVVALPESWTADRPRCRQAGIPDRVAFHTKPQLPAGCFSAPWTPGCRPPG